MRIIAITFACVLLSTGLSAQQAAVADTVFNQVDNNNLKQGHWKKYYKNGKVAYKGYFKDDKPRGVFLRYHEGEPCAHGWFTASAAIRPEQPYTIPMARRLHGGCST